MLARAAGIWLVTVSPSPTVRYFRFFSASLAAASSTVRPVTVGVDTSTAADSASVYCFSIPR